MVWCRGGRVGRVPEPAQAEHAAVARGERLDAEPAAGVVPCREAEEGGAVAELLLAHGAQREVDLWRDARGDEGLEAVLREVEPAVDEAVAYGMAGRVRGQGAVALQEVAEGDAVGAGGRRDGVGGERARGVEVGYPAVLDAYAVARA